MKAHRLPIHLLFAFAIVASAIATPQFARETKMPCSACHSHVPRLNAFGQQFYASGLKTGDLRLGMTNPFWVQVAAEASAVPRARTSTTFDDNAVVAGGLLGSETIFHLMAFPITRSLELYLIQPVTKHFSLTAGTIAPTSQFDPELEFAFGESAVLAPEGFLPEGMDDMPPFQLGEGVLGARAVYGERSGLPYGEGWNLAVTTPLSNGIMDIGQPSQVQTKGALFEGYRREGLNSVGGSYFSGPNRWFGAVLGQHKVGSLYLQGGVGAGKFLDTNLTAYSFSVDWNPAFADACGVRLDMLNGHQSATAIVSHILGGGASALSLRLEGQVMRGELPRVRASALLRF